MLTKACKHPGKIPLSVLRGVKTKLEATIKYPIQVVAIAAGSQHICFSSPLCLMGVAGHNLSAYDV